MQFAVGDSKVIFASNLFYQPKIITSDFISRIIELAAIVVPPISTEEEQRH